MTEAGIVHLRKTEARRLRAGHPWVFSNEILAVEGAPGAGDLVQVVRAGGRFLGRGFYHPHSLIAVRLLTLDPEESVDEALLERRLREAVAYRKEIYPDADAVRLVHGEADFLPGLVVDRYADVLVVQALSAGMDRLLDLLADRLMSITGGRAVVERDESPLRDLEGLPRRTRVLRGEVSGPVAVHEGGLHLEVDVLGGQKTGAFLDQRENRAAVRRLASDRRVLDAFCHEGWFGLQAAAGGAREVVGMDSSAAALERARANAERNGLADRCRFLQGDALHELAGVAQDGGRFDLVILDPPSFTRTRRQVPQARQAYRDLHRQALAVLRRGGLLATASCSHHIREDAFLETVVRASHERHRRLRVVTLGSQSPDHPVLPEVPETRYLKFALFQAL